MTNITLNDFLLLLFVSDNEEISRFNFINTNNNSFPKKYRYKFITTCNFYAELYKKDNEYNLLDRKIKYVSLLPMSFDIDNYKYINFFMTSNDGFLEDGLLDFNHLCPAIHIVLEDK